MIGENQEEARLLNTAIIKSKENVIDATFEKRLYDTCQRPAMKALGYAISQLSEMENISRDQAALQIVEIVRDLDDSWKDYLIMEGIGIVKEKLKDYSH